MTSSMAPRSHCCFYTALCLVCVTPTVLSSPVAACTAAFVPTIAVNTQAKTFDNLQSKPLVLPSTSALWAGVKRGSLFKNVGDDVPKKAPQKTSQKQSTSGREKKKGDSHKNVAKSDGISPALAKWAFSSQQSSGDDVLQNGEQSTKSFGMQRGTGSSTESQLNTLVDDPALTFTSFESDIDEEEEGNVKVGNSDRSRKTGRSSVLSASQSKNEKSATSSRRQRQTGRQSEEKVIATRTKQIVASIDDLCNAKRRDLTAIMTEIQKLINNSQKNHQNGIRTLASGPRTRHYRLAFAGSDKAVCHLGSGLHNVPLARLQEIFMTLGKNVVEVLEIIRILGPFPNVKNTLRGDASNVRNKDIEKHNKSFCIIYNSMIDGTGKEILAGKEENTRIVNLDVLYASENAIIFQATDQEKMRKKEKQIVEKSKGSSAQGREIAKDGIIDLLVFFREDEFDAKLETLRVS